jgi:tRNA A-37 threonylcarbamoyl transferase component Bud32
MRHLRFSPFLSLLFAGAAVSQPGPQVAFPGAPDLAAYVAEVRAAPTTAQNALPRFQRLIGTLQHEGIPPGPEVDHGLQEIRRMMMENRAPEAAVLIDRIAIHLELRRAVDAGSARRGLGELGSQAPAMLSGPPRGAAIESPAPRPAEVPRAEIAAAPAAESQGPPWPFFIALGLAALAGAGLLKAAGRFAKKPAAAPEPSKTLTEKYELGRVIASGGMGEVHEGRDLSLGRRVAIKRMLPQIKLDAGLRSQFLSEARTVAKLSHPYIVPIHECLESGGDLYLVFEYVEGETLHRRLAREARLPLKECRRILRYVCAAIEHAHERHVLHRDLKPANIMLDTGGIARVMDFGIALESTRTMTSTEPGALDASGTLRYMPPEQHYGKSVRASDIYAMAVCLYEMATGHPPFAAANVDELIDAKRSRRYPAPSSLRPELSKEFDLFIAAALEPDAQNRISSAPEFIELLDAI